MSEAPLRDGKASSQTCKAEALNIHVSFYLNRNPAAVLTAVKNGFSVSCAKSPFSGSIAGTFFACSCFCRIKSAGDAAGDPAAAAAAATPLGSICKEE